MPTKTSIEWTDYSANLIRYRDADGKDVWACAKVSPGCAHCYSEAIAHRYKRGGPFTKDQVRKVTPYFAEEEATKILRSKSLAGKRVFIGDMTDVFGEWVPDELLDKMFAVFAMCPDVTFQVLTKRADRLREYFCERTPNDIWVSLLQEHDSYGIYQQAPEWIHRFQSRYRTTEDYHGGIQKERFQWHFPHAWPLSNVWIGASCEDQQRADERIPHLLQAPAAVRFLSCEPLLGPVDLSQFIFPKPGTDARAYERQPDPGLHWVIVGGESGGDSRPCQINWVRSIVGQCKTAGVACFVKQLGANAVVDASAVARERLKLRDRKGGDIEDFPSDLRVRELPTPAAEVRS